MSIYLLTAGEYSDFHVVAAFATRKAAEQAAKVWEENSNPNSYCDVNEVAQEVELYEDLPEHRLCLTKYAYMNPQQRYVSSAHGHQILTNPAWEIVDQVEVLWPWDGDRYDVRVKVVGDQHISYQNNYYVCVRGTDHQAVKKVFADRYHAARAQLGDPSPPATPPTPPLSMQTSDSFLVTGPSEPDEDGQDGMELLRRIGREARAKGIEIEGDDQ